MKKHFLLLIIFLGLGLSFYFFPHVQTIAAGVAVFLLGMMTLEDGFKVFTGGVLEKFLHKATNTRLKSLSFGVVVTSLIQSSSLLSVIAISFVSAGLIPLIQGIGIIFGANLGTTTGAWLVAGFGLKVNIALYAMPMLVFGVILLFQKKQKPLRGAGKILIGLGFLFLGIAFMKDGFASFSEGIDLTKFAMTGLSGLLVYTAIGIGITVLMQSSHATLILTITALAAGQVSYENALALAIGSNVGTTITAILGALSANLAGKRLAGAHLIFNVITGALAIVFINFFIASVDFISIYLGIGDDNYTLKLALFHSFFNLLGVAIMLPFMQRLANFLENSLFQNSAVSNGGPLYLNDAALEMTDVSLFVLRKEINYLANLVFELIIKGFGLDKDLILNGSSLKKESLNKDVDELIDIQKMYFVSVKPVYSAIIEFSARVEPEMTGDQAKVLGSFRQGAENLIVALKLSRELQVNCRRYSQSDNKYMKHEYERVRLSLAKLLRELIKLYNSGDHEMQMAGVKAVKARANQNSLLDQADLDKMIREGLVDSSFVVSLMNDSIIRRRLVKVLLRAAKQMFGGFMALEQDAEFSESESEVNGLLEETETEMAINLKSLDDLK